MPGTALAQTMRIIELVAWLSQRDSGEPVSYRRAAARLGVTEQTLRQDLQVLVRLGDEFKGWLASLSVGFVADGFLVRSRGPYRRPFRLTPDEVLALAVGLAGARRGREIAAKFLATLPPDRRPGDAAERLVLGPVPSPHVETVLALARRARDERRKLEIGYCGSAGEPSERVICPHQLLQHQNRWYVYAWCEKVGGFRLFRAERFLAARLLEARFERRPDFRPLERADQLLVADRPVVARVVFDRGIARWLRERYPGGRELPGGRYEVSFTVADAAWFVREILQYGAEAEVVEPAGLREAVRRMV
ncbi:MAG TPA: WYL domain-containing protein [Gemmatimonadales bacterium]|nr:WYL domain-containing protein [Gemmatimonadales bacterium]